MKKYKRYYQEDADTFLLEKTYDINKDVDYLYNKYFKPVILKIKKDTFKSSISEITILGVKGILFKILDSSELESNDCKKANLLNPADIYLGTFQAGSLYTGKTGNKSIILISVSYSAFEALNQLPYSDLIKIDKNNIGDKIKLDLLEHTIKSSIAHELSHWLNDSIHNEFLTKLLKLSIENDNDEVLKLKNLDVNLTYFELDAQIHSIKQLKRDFKKQWDNLTLYNMIFKLPTLVKIYTDIYEDYGEKIMRIWQTNLIKRMDREGLLGRKMKIFTEKDRRHYI